MSRDNPLVIMPSRLTAENGAKAELIGEFCEKITVSATDENGDFDEQTIEVPITWSTIKKIYEAAIKLLATPLSAAERIEPGKPVSSRSLIEIIQENQKKEQESNPARPYNFVTQDRFNARDTDEFRLVCCSDGLATEWKTVSMSNKSYLIRNCRHGDIITGGLPALQYRVELRCRECNLPSLRLPGETNSKPEPEPEWFDLTNYVDHVWRSGIDQMSDGKGGWRYLETMDGKTIRELRGPWYERQFRCPARFAPPELVAAVKATECIRTFDCGSGDHSEPEWFDLTPFGKHRLRKGIDRYEKNRDDVWLPIQVHYGATVDAMKNKWGHDQKFRCLLKDAPPDLVAKAHKPAEDPDEWVTQDMDLPRTGIDEFRWVSNTGSNNGWYPVCKHHCLPYMHGETDPADGLRLELRCRRRDLPLMLDSKSKKETVAKASKPTEDPDEWVTQDRVLCRAGIDDTRWIRDIPGDEWVGDWKLFNGATPSYMHGERKGNDEIYRIEVRCRRRDLPQMPEQSPKPTTHTYHRYVTPFGQEFWIRATGETMEK